MSRIGLHRTLWFFIAITLIIVVPCGASRNPKDRIDYWQKNYEELLPKDDPRAARAHEIFQRVLDAAGRRPGVVPRLFIVKSESPYIPLAFAIPDGGIIISKRVLDICYQDPNRGDDRLAFVLGHEIAHQLKDDFWHMRFFQAITLSEGRDTQDHEVLEEVRKVASLTDKVLAKELQADEHGIIYASMAGFNTGAIVAEDDKVNFFEYFYKSLDPAQIEGVQKDSTHPNPKQRAETVKARLKQVLDKVDLFELGLMCYQTGDYQRAILFFGEFLRFFPSREVYHNLASSHHQLALKYYQDWKKDKQGIPFKLSLAIDPVTRASQITLRGKGPEELFSEHMEKAVKYYQTAISQDPSYVLSYNNLGCALILKGEVYKAIATLKDALKLAPDSPETLNNLGVAFFYAENPTKARAHLSKASELDPEYDFPLFNLGRIALEENKRAGARKYWTAYLKLDPASPWALSIRKTLSLDQPQRPTRPIDKTEEIIMGLEAGAYDDEIPQSWGKPLSVKKISLEEEPFRKAVYSNSVMTLSQDDEILMIATLEGCEAKTAGGISLDSLEEDVLTAYGTPSRSQNMTQGKNWAYDSRGIAFQLRGGKVVSWLLFAR